MNPNNKPIPKLRIARPTDNITALLPFYTTGLGLQILSQFTNHAGFDGIMLGHASSPYHLEFTHFHGEGHSECRAPSQDNLLVFYLPDEGEWRAAVEAMKAAGFEPVKAFNPYWDREGRTFEDPDGYRVVLQKGAWDL